MEIDALLPSKTTTELATVTRDPYYEAMATWLEGKPANTRRSYWRALQDMLTFTGRHPGQVKPIHIAAWKEEMKRQGRADTTIAQRLSAVSSYYLFLQRPLESGEPLQAHNPVHGVERADLEVSPYDKANKISAEDFRKILDQVDVMKPRTAFPSHLQSHSLSNQLNSSTMQKQENFWD